MSSTDSKDEIILSEHEGVKINIENCTSEVEDDGPLNAFDAAHGLEPHISSLNYTFNLNSGEDSDSEENCIVKTEEEAVQIYEVTPYTCDMCNATYDGLASYEVHLKDKHEVHNVTSDLKKHKRNHTGERPYKCDECTSSFTTTNNLKIHKMSHSGERPYKCQECTSSFTTTSNLKTHKMSHAGERPHKCDECTSSFAVTSRLKTHKMRHTGERPYKCDKCTSSFKQKCDLKRHKRIHTGERHYTCDECTSTFTEMGSLKQHKMSHTGE